MLACLMEHPGRVVSRDRLFDEVWDDEVDIRSNALEVHVSRLRDHLTASADVHIGTVRGVGYRLELGSP
jgi:DNA-binding response OmpR family regulator